MAEICNGGIIMKYGKIRIEDGNLVFARHMMMNSSMQGYPVGL